MVKSRNKQIWENAFPLSDAWLEFADADDQFAFINEKGFVETFTQTAKKEPDQGIWNAMKLANSSLINRNSMQGKLQRELVLRLQRRELTAIGFRVAPTRSPTVISINSAAFLNGKISWSRDTMVALGLSYSEIRVFDPSTLPVNQKSKIGRPGSIDAIDYAIISLAKSDPDFANKRRKIASDQIRTFLGETEKRGNGLSPTNLAKRIVLKLGSREIKK